MKTLQIGIAGAGPAGLAVALMLSPRGHRVEILERFDEASPVGSGLMLQPTGLSVLSTALPNATGTRCVSAAGLSRAGL